MLMALLQPAPEVYDLFDDILLLCEGGRFTLSPVFGVQAFTSMGRCESIAACLIFLYGNVVFHA